MTRLKISLREPNTSSSFNNALKNHLKLDFDIFQFLKYFERAVQEKGEKELQFKFEARKNIPRRWMCTPMLVQASEVYTIVIFKAFQGQYERFMDAWSRALDENKYTITVGNFMVIWVLRKSALWLVILWTKHRVVVKCSIGHKYYMYMVWKFLIWWL